jgi:hypothetical protein
MYHMITFSAKIEHAVSSDFGHDSDDFEQEKKKDDARRLATGNHA